MTTCPPIERTYLEDIQDLAPSEIITLYELQILELQNGQRVIKKDENQNDLIFRFHIGVNSLGQDIKFDGLEYVRFPIEAEGFERRSDGRMPRPRISIVNVEGLLSAVVREYDDLLGSRLIRTRTFARYLDASNFPNGNNEADPNKILDREVWYIDRKSNENKIFIEFELKSIYDLSSVKLPRRQVIQNVCVWSYRGPECGYAGGPVADINDVPTNDPKEDQCGKRLESCKLRFPGDRTVLPYGGFPGAGLFR